MVRAAATRNSAFNFEKAISMGLKIRVVGREIEQARFDRLDGLSNAMDFVSGQVVHDNGVARPQRWSEQLVDIGRASIGPSRTSGAIKPS
jgi:hypothetical protein